MVHEIRSAIGSPVSVLERRLADGQCVGPTSLLGPRHTGHGVVRGVTGFGGVHFCPSPDRSTVPIVHRVGPDLVPKAGSECTFLQVQVRGIPHNFHG